MSFLKRLGGLFSGSKVMAESESDDAEAALQALWQANYDARARYFGAELGPLPRDILKMFNLTGLWPGGGLFVIPAAKLGQSLCAYTSCGLSNPDMLFPARDPAEPVKAPAPAGYGYEILVLAEPDAKWAINLLQWAVSAEISGGADLLGRVEQYDGVTVEDVQVGQANGDVAQVLIAKAQPPLPTGTELPAGNMQLLVATVITREEMAWSGENGRGALLRKLQAAGVGQVSVLRRSSVVG